MADTDSLNESATELLNTIDSFSNTPHHERYSVLPFSYDMFSRVTYFYCFSWVMSVEECLDSLPSALASLAVVDPGNFDRAVSILIDWCVEGLSEQSAMRQPKSHFKVRHLKMGLRLTRRMVNLYEKLTLDLLVSAKS